MEKTAALHFTCEHCGTSFFRTKPQRFCCEGCEFVFSLIQSKGLGEFYGIKSSNPPVCSIPVKPSTTSAFEYFNDIEFIKLYSSDGVRMRFFLENINCTACLWLLEKLPTFCNDVEFAKLNMTTSTILIRRHSEGSFAKIAQTLSQLGYQPHALLETESSELLQMKERRRDLIRIGTAGALTGNIMILSVSIYAGAAGLLAQHFELLSALLALPVLTFCAWPFYRSTLSGIKLKQLNLDIPIVVAIIAGIITSVWSIFTGAGLVYFDSLSMLVFLLLSSRFILKSVQNQQMGSTNLADEILLQSVFRLRPDGSHEKTSSTSLVKGDLIFLQDSGIVPIDGTVESGTGWINTSVMTGESQPIAIGPSDIVEAGSQNLGGDWILRVMHPSKETRLAKILADTERTAKNKPKVTHFSDLISRWFIAIVLFAAAVVVLFFASVNLQEGVTRALALVIVTCPCVFGIAIPLSMSLAMRGAARKGIIIKDSDAVEKLWKVDSLYFDKTGTLTTGKMSVLEVSGATESSLSIAFELEKNQSHPVAQAIVTYIKPWNLANQKVENISLIKEGGVQGQVNADLFCLIPITYSTKIQRYENDIIAAYGLFKNQNLITTFYLSDEIRSESLSLLTWARGKNFFTRILSGDKKKVVEACAKKFCFSERDTYWEISPEQKASIINENSSRSVMIGDGANDAAALAAAEVGIAVCGSLDVSLRAADIYLARPNLNLVAELFQIATLTKKAIIRNLIFSVSFNLVSGTLAILGMMTPLWAAVLMPVSSLTVLLSSLWTGNLISNLKE